MYMNSQETIDNNPNGAQQGISIDEEASKTEDDEQSFGIRDFFFFYRYGFLWLMLSLTPIITFCIGSLLNIEQLFGLAFLLSFIFASYRWYVSRWLPRIRFLYFRCSMITGRYSSDFVEDIVDSTLGVLINFALNAINIILCATIYVFFAWWIMEFVIQSKYIIEGIIVWRMGGILKASRGRWPGEPE